MTTRMTTRTRRNRRLARELDQFRTRADLLELAAVLDRHDDAKTEPLRDLVDWTRAA